VREILFRGFHPDENGPQEITLDGIKIKGRWVQGDFAHPCNIIVEEIGDDPALGQKNVTIFNDYDVLPETVGQHIGIDDKNEKKIFDGDIVDIYRDEERGVIEWYDDEAAFFVRHSENVLTDFSCYWGRDLEVIGDVFSNPELIGGAEE
jgi:uncharacterized phage protein (TIGR01671 family)